MATTVKARIQLKHDTEENWSKALNFIPLKGQPIIYDTDPDNGQPFPRFKVGDGTTPVVDLPFLTAHSLDGTVEYNTTEYWGTRRDYVPEQGKIIIYADKYNNTTPGIKVGDGTTFLVDLPFITDIFTQQLQEHITNTSIHVSSADRIFWNNKLNLEDVVEEETLQLNRR